MRTRSQSRNSNRQQQQVNLTFVEPFNLVEPIENQAPPVVTMDDNRTMAQLLEAPTEGYEDAIVVPEITADNFELKHGTLPSNTITNPKTDLKGITTRSGVAYQGPTILTTSSHPKVVEHETEVTKDMPVVAPVSAPKPNLKPSIPYMSRLNDQKIREKANNQIEKFYQIFQDLHFESSFADALILMPKFASTLKKSVTFNLDQTSRYSSNYDDNSVNRIDVIEMAYEEYSQEVLGFSDMIASGNPTPYYDPIVSTSSLTLTPFRDIDFLFEEVDAFLALVDDPTSTEVDHSYYDSEEDILLLEAFLNDDPSLPPPTQGNYLPEIRKELKRPSFLG
ncbi:hypothetical protein Tco_0377775 [Tanacetum coccineum]